VIKLLESRGFTVEPDEVEFNGCLTELGERNYTADIVATLRLIVEIDGKDHGSRIHKHKDEVRDDYFRHIQNAPTIRIAQDVAVGKKKMSDALLMAEFCYQIFSKGVI